MADPLPPDARLMDVTAWDGGFFVPEDHLMRSGDSTVVAFWNSSSGQDWTRTELPADMKSLWRVVPFRGGLVAAVFKERPSPDSIDLALWRSNDGATWSRMGSFHTELPGALQDDWDPRVFDLLEVRDHLVLLTGIVHHEAGSGGWVPSAPGVAVAAVTSQAGARPEQMIGWSSDDGDTWTEHAVTGVSSPSGGVDLENITKGRGRLLGLSILEHGYAAVGSTDGLRWDRIADVPRTYDWGGSEGNVETDGAVLLFADDDRPNAAGFGNPLGAWRFGPDERWTRVLARQPGFTHQQAVDGDLVIVVGDSWSGDSRWYWTLVSLDGARTWDPDLSWTGSIGTCVGDVAIHDETAVMLGCSDGQPAIWAAPLPR